MAEDSFKTILFGFILVSLFGTLILTVVVEEANLYDKDYTEITGGELNLGLFNSTTQDIRESGENYREQFSKQNIFSNIAGVVVTGIFDIANSMISMIILPFTLVGNIMTNVLHVPDIVTNVILGLLVISIIFSIWSLVKVGN